MTDDRKLLLAVAAALLILCGAGGCGTFFYQRQTRVSYVNSDPRQPAQKTVLDSLAPVLTAAAPALGGAVGGPWTALATLGGLALIQGAENMRTVEGVGVHLSVPTPDGADVTVELDGAGNLRRAQITTVRKP